MLLIARIANIVVVILEVIGLGISISARKAEIFVYYTQLSNIAALIASLAFAIFGPVLWVGALRLVAAASLAMTFLVTTCVLIPMGASAKDLLVRGNGLYHHVLCPLISVASFMALEGNVMSPWMAAIPIALTLIYGFTMLALNAKEVCDGPYPFFRVKHQSTLATIVWMAALTAVISAISILMLWIG